VNGDRRVLMRRAGSSVAAALAVVAAAVLLITVEVRGGGRSVSCGSGWDVVAGRSGWRQWWAQDQADPVAGNRLLRTNDCVGAVNAHIVAATVLVVIALAVCTAAALATRRGGPDEVDSPPARRLRRIGMSVAGIGAVLTGAGLTGIALLTADPAAPLFLYVGRTTVVLLGLVLLLPVVLLVVLGRAASLLAEGLDRDRTTDEPA
jgi:hypothetical protein